MRPIILTFTILLFCSLLKGQDVKQDSSKFTYCELVGTAKFLSNKVTVEIDFGQELKFFADNRYKDPATGRPAVFNSMVDALNFMGDRGWEFVQAYVVTSGNGASSQNVYHWLLKKPK